MIMIMVSNVYNNDCDDDEVDEKQDDGYVN